MLKKVLSIFVLVFFSVIIAWLDYVLVQWLVYSKATTYDFNRLGLTDWTVKTIMFGLALWALIWIVKIQQVTRDKIISFVIAIFFGTVIVPTLVAVVHMVFFRKGDSSVHDQRMSEMLYKVSLTDSALFAHFITALTLAAIGFMYIFYFPKQAKETKNKLETAPDLGTNEDG